MSLRGKRQFGARVTGLVIAGLLLASVIVMAAGGNVSVDMKDADLQEVLLLMAQESGQQIVIQDGVAGRVTVSLYDVPLERALELILAQTGFSWTKEADAYIVGLKPAEPVAADMPVREAIAAASSDVSPAYVPAGQDLMGLLFGTGANVPEPSAYPMGISAPPSAEIVTEKLRLSYIDCRDLLAYMAGGETFSHQFLASRRGESKGGGNVYGGDSGGSGGTVGVYGQFGGRSSSGQSGRSSQSGGNYQGTGGRQSGGFGQSGGGMGGGGYGMTDLLPAGVSAPMAYDIENAVIISGTREGIDQFRELVKLMDIPPKQVLITAEFLEVSTSDTESFGIDWRFFNGGELDVSILGAPGSQNTSVKYAKGNFRATLAALKSQGRGRVINAPRVATINNFEAEVDFTTEYPYWTASVTYNEFGQRQVDYELETTDVSTYLYVLPRINGDDSITVYVEPDIEEVVGTATGPDGQTQPIIASRSVSSYMRVKDGETIVLGGLITQNKQESTRKTPILSDLPLIGRLFTSKTTEFVDTELLIFLTPEILRDETTEKYREALMQ